MNYQLDLLINNNTLYKNIIAFTREKDRFCIQFDSGRKGYYKNINNIKPIIREIKDEGTICNI